MTIPILAASILGLLERLPQVRFRAAPFWRPHAMTDAVYLATGYVAVSSLALAYVAVTSAWIGAHTGLPAWWLHVPFVAQVLAALIALDLGNFGCHLLLHRVDLLWRFHEAHHSSPHLDWLATFRSHLVEQIVRRLLAPLLVIALGIPMPAVALAVAVLLGWVMLNHANVRLPLDRFEGVVVTPRLHRAHHMPATTERNLGGVFTWWDRLLGTFVVSDPSPERPFGLPQRRPAYPQDWARQLVAPFALRAASATSPAGISDRVRAGAVP